MSARDDVLSRVRRAVAGAAPVPAPERHYRRTGEHPPGAPALLDLLADRLVDYRAEVRRTAVRDLPAAVAAAVRDGLAGREIEGPARVVVPPGLDRGWLAGVDAEVVVDGGLSALALDALHAVVTAATVAVAETGTIVLDASPDQGRRALSLVPDLHVCVVRAEQVVASVPEGVARVDPTRPLTWVSGPSATSDIELVRVEGVHGPRRLQVVLVEDDRPGGVQDDAPRGRRATTQEQPDAPARERGDRA